MSREDDRMAPTHPGLLEEEDAEQRGEDPPETVGSPKPAADDSEDPTWQPDPNASDPWRELIAEWGREHRPNREDVLPYLLIRAFAPGDRAQRPTWPPQPSWLSPDVLLIDDAWTGPFQGDQVVDSPIAGRSYRVFVHAWNLGLLPAVGVHLRAWHVAPGFFGGTPGVYTPELIGGAFVDLGPRAAPGAHKLVEVIPAWSIPPSLTGHECLLAAVECPADRWGGVLDANNDRHVGQRNLSILGPQQDMRPLLEQLGRILGQREFLELTLDTSEAKATIQYGVPMRGGQHLLVATKQDDRLLVVPTTRLGDLLGERPPDLSEAGTAAGLFAKHWPRFEGELGNASLDVAFARLLDTDDLRAATVARVLGGDGGYTLHLAAFNEDGRPTGGYSIRPRTQDIDRRR